MAICYKCKREMGESDEAFWTHWISHHRVEDILDLPAFRELQQEEGVFTRPNNDDSKKPA